MRRKPTLVLPLATAIAALFNSGATDKVKAAMPIDANATSTADELAQTKAETLAVGNDLLGVVVSEHGDGKVFAQHVSHASHASHASHVSSR